MNQIEAIAEAMGVTFDARNSHTLHRSLTSLKPEHHPDVFSALTTLAMQVAQYFAVGTCTHMC